MPGESNGEVQLSVQCRDGPLTQRRCTDVLCCIIYLLLLASIIFLAIFASSAIKMSRAEVEAKLEKRNDSNPLLAVSSSITYIVLSLACVVAVSFVLVVISFIIPSVSAYVIIPLILLFMLLLGTGFIYSYFGKRLPFIGEGFQ